MGMAYIFYQYEKALEWVEKVKTFEKLIVNSAYHTFFIFYELLLYVALARNKTCIKKYNDRIVNGLNLYRKWSKSCPENFLNKHLLLEAEVTSVYDEDLKNVFLRYDNAISLSRKSGFINETALACERASIFCLSSDYTTPEKYIKWAFDAYVEWGATAKVSHLKQSYPAYFTDVDSTSQVNSNLSAAVSELSISTNLLVDI